jgi:hypothetical protein
MNIFRQCVATSLVTVRKYCLHIIVMLRPTGHNPWIPPLSSHLREAAPLFARWPGVSDLLSPLVANGPLGTREVAGSRWAVEGQYSYDVHIHFGDESDGYVSCGAGKNLMTE